VGLGRIVLIVLPLLALLAGGSSAQNPPPNCFGPFSRPPLRGFLVITAELHFSEYPFALHFFL